MSLRLGWLPDAPDDRDVLLGASPLMKIGTSFGSDEVDLRPFQGPVDDQIAEDCTAHALRNVAVGTACFLRTPIAIPSVFFPWAAARLLAKPKQPLVDEGCSLRLMFKALSSRGIREVTDGLGYGLVSEELWPETPETRNAIPPEDCWRAGENATIRSYAAIPDGAASPAGLLTVLRRGRPATIAMIVDQAFADVGKGVYKEPGGAPIGGHAMTVVGYSPTLKAFLLKNSWGVDFGDDGYAWVDEDHVALRTFGKFYVEIMPA